MENVEELAKMCRSFYHTFGAVDSTSKMCVNHASFHLFVYRL